ncbi:MAG: nucleotidyl transferase AbiEii/AbiGii toxin family protein [Minisyncoccales bacterium]
MFTEVLSKTQKDLLAVLGKSQVLKDAYLAGGTALALQFGHRFSYDFDFFTLQEFKEDILVQHIKKLIPDFHLDRMEWGTILGTIKNIRFSLFFYDYLFLFKTHDFLGIDIADVKDIAPMKLAAISQRGSRKDFIDLYFIIAKKEILSLPEILELYDKKFKYLAQNKIHILKSLSYFADAEQEEMPKMKEETNWKEIKSYFENEVKKISKNVL